MNPHPIRLNEDELWLVLTALRSAANKWREIGFASPQIGKTFKDQAKQADILANALAKQFLGAK